MFANSRLETESDFENLNHLPRSGLGNMTVIKGREVSAKNIVKSIKVWPVSQTYPLQNIIYFAISEVE